MADSNEFFSGFVVVLKDDVNNEKMLKIKDALLMIKDIVDVQPIGKEKIEQRIQRSRIKDEIMRAIQETVSKI